MELRKINNSDGNRYLNTDTQLIRFVINRLGNYWTSDSVVISKEVIAPLSEVFASDRELLTNDILDIYDQDQIKKKQREKERESSAEKVGATNNDEDEENDWEYLPGRFKIDMVEMKAAAKKDVLELIRETRSVTERMSARERTEFYQLCDKYGYKADNFPSIFNLCLEDIELINTPRQLWQLWIYDKYIHNRVGRTFISEDVFKTYSDRIGRGEFRRGIKKEYRHYSYVIYAYLDILESIGLVDRKWWRGSKKCLYTVLGDCFPLYNNPVDNAMLAIALETQRLVIPEFKEKVTEFIHESKQLNRERQEEMQQQKEKTQSMKQVIEGIFGVIEPDINLVSKWEYDFIVEMNTRIHKNWILTDKQIETISKINLKVNRSGAKR
ncbi:hypothetical protein GCM10010916_38470 [Paenibacillus abyssi]|uniref:Uncharacterized protein n=2 Tax=Paenibacillus abyssi TaxID=1340531 RepID=A0A917G1E0_9BACL|nr:hypothetical protein GCM10010916_38470 [Paenibacillus abyssi]